MYKLYTYIFYYLHISNFFKQKVITSSRIYKNCFQTNLHTHTHTLLALILYLEHEVVLMNKGCTCAVLVALIDNASIMRHASSLVPPLAAQCNFVEVNTLSKPAIYITLERLCK